MRSKCRLNIALLLAAVILTGCQPALQDEGVEPVVKPRTLNVYEIAQRLGLKVDDIQSTNFRLVNPANIVLIFIFDGGEVYVNGESIGQVGEIGRLNGSTRLPETLVKRIGAKLTPYSPPPRPIPTPRPGIFGNVVIDAGHGGKDPGTTGVNGAAEKWVNLAVARKVASLLERRGVNVRLTRDGDFFLELEDRAEVANRIDAQLFVSLHADSVGDRSVGGYTVYVAREASWASKKAADEIEAAMGSTGLSSRGRREADYRVLVKTSGPAVLVEMGYLSNRREADMLTDESFQNRMASAIAQGIIAFLQ